VTDTSDVPVGLIDTYASRRYFRKFDAIISHMMRVAAVMEADGKVAREEVAILTRYAVGLSHTFRALGHKYLFAGRDTGNFFGSLAIDATESGFPMATEVITMAHDAQQAEQHLASLPSVNALKDDMVKAILGDRELPTKLQFAMSQRLYYEELFKGALFWARNDPQVVWTGNLTDRRRAFRVHWAVYDSQMNMPVIYIMEVEDSGRVALPKDTERWPAVQAYLMAQSLGSLKLLTIAKGFDQDFDDLHPKRLRRFHVGPMYSSAYTRQVGPLLQVLVEANAEEGDDWALVWTEEDLVSDRVTEERSGWFSTVEREIFALDPFGGKGAETGATDTRRNIILPQRPYQVLAERNPPGFASVRKFVVSGSGRVLQY
jgi:hypothetical protein